MLRDMFNKLTGAVTVSQDGALTRISGVAGQLISEDIRRMMKTTVITNNMFTRITNNYVEFPTFFALEMEYLLRQMLNEDNKRNRYVYSSKATIQLCIDELRERTWLNGIQHGQDIPLNLDNLKRIVYPLKDHQKRFLAWYAYAKDRYNLRGMLLTAAPGGGKAQPLYSKIKLHSGVWTTMGNIKVGDVVATPDGKGGVIESIFPQGLKDIYEITLANGKKARGCNEHLWEIKVAGASAVCNTETLFVAMNMNAEVPYMDDDGTEQYSKLISIDLVDHCEAQCIMISHERHVYITDDSVITHNTISGISVAETTECDAVIVVAPANAVENVWAKTLEELMTVPTPHWVSRNRDKVPVPKNCKYFIYHYEDLPVALAMVQRGMIKGKICVILDESHNFNDPSSQRTQRFELLCKLTQSNNIIYSSGTPIKAMGADTIPLLRVLDPMFTEDVEARFKKIYGKNAQKANELLANRLGIISYKVPKAEFMVDKPIEYNIKVPIPNGNYFTLDEIKIRMEAYIKERVAFYKKHEKVYEETYLKTLEKVVPLLTPDQKKEYNEYEKIVKHFRKYGYDNRTDGPLAKQCNSFEKFIIIPLLENEEKKLFREAKSVYKYVDLKIRGECLGNVLGRERIMANVELAKYIDYKNIIDTAEKKSIFFTSHTEVVAEGIRQATRLGYRPLMVTAETNKDLKQIVSKFGTDQKANPLFATYQSLSTAVPLVMANVIVAMNSPFRAHEMEQAISRAYRIGQDQIVKVYYLTIDTGDKPNISTRSADIMEWSKEQVNQIMGYSSRDDIDLDAIDMEDFHTSASMTSSFQQAANEYQDEVSYGMGDTFDVDYEGPNNIPGDVLNEDNISAVTDEGEVTLI